MKLGLFVIAGAVMVCLQAAGCADPAADVGADGQGLTAEPTPIDLPNPSGAFAAKLAATGTGCPAGIWDATIAPDGHAVTLRFYQAEIDLLPGTESQIKDCTVALDLTAPEGHALAFSASNVLLRAFLDMSEGTTMRHSAKAYFTGNPIPAMTEHDTAGPLEDGIASALSPSGDPPFSQCAATNRLNLQLQLVAHNNPEQTGFVLEDDEPVDVEQHSSLGFDLDWKPCGS
jgi:hypothetical protein